jgi:hypothetical protein
MEILPLIRAGMRKQVKGYSVLYQIVFVTCSWALSFKMVLK